MHRQGLLRLPGPKVAQPRLSASLPAPARHSEAGLSPCCPPSFCCCALLACSWSASFLLSSSTWGREARREFRGLLLKVQTNYQVSQGQSPVSP